MPSIDHVILVNEDDEAIGVSEKIKAHELGLLHRAFSIFILNDKNQLLIHKRAQGKYHSGGLWTNTCCSHPKPEEDTLAAANRRLMEEMGFQCSLQPIFHFKYKSDVNQGLIEHEYDHVLMGQYDGAIQLNPSEVEDYKYIDILELDAWVNSEPNAFTVWFRLILPKFIHHLNS